MGLRLDYSGAEHFVTVVPYGELARRNATLRCLEKNEQAGLSHDEKCILERLAITDTDTVTSDVTRLHPQILANPMNLVRPHHKTTARQALVLMPLPHINDILVNVSGNHEKRILVTADIQSLSLTDSIELRPLMTSDDSSIRIGLVTSLLYMMLS